MLIIDAVKQEKTTMSHGEFAKLYLESPWKKVLYIHTPYCPSKCKYCICKSVACSDQHKVDEYANQILIPQILAEASVLENVAFSEVYFGGGTPTYMSPAVLKAVFDSIPNFKSIPNKCIEGSPNTIQQEHIDLFKNYDFNFVSVGVQSLQKDVCSWQKRTYISKLQLAHLSDVLRKNGLYFNYDLISYLGHGDFRDIPGFEEDLRFLMSECRPSSINIHHHHQTTYTTEKMIKLYEVMRNALTEFSEYECINSRLFDADAYNDIVYQAQYRFVREKRNYTHYMWNKYPEIPVLGWDIFSVGYTDSISPKSNAGNISYKPGSETFKRVAFNEALYEDYRLIRDEKGLE